MTVSVGQLMTDKLVVGPTFGTALGLPLVEPEPHNGSVVLFTQTAYQPFVTNAWDNVRVFFGSSILLGFQNAPRILSFLQCL